MGLSGLMPARERAIAVASPADEPPRPWSLPLVAVSAALWGAGLVAPWDRARVAGLAAQLNLCASDRVMLVGAGPGGVAALLSAVSGAEVFAYEADPVLASLGQTRSFRPRHPEFGRRRFDHAVILEGWEGGRLEDLLAGVAFALRPGGRILLDAALPDPERACRILRLLRCEVTAAEDHSAGVARVATSAWAGMAARLQQAGGESRLPQAGRLALRDMAQDWMRHLGRLRSGQLRHVRLVAHAAGIGLCQAA